jgi:hypothetical protein
VRALRRTAPGRAPAAKVPLAAVVGTPEAVAERRAVVAEAEGARPAGEAVEVAAAGAVVEEGAAAVQPAPRDRHRPGPRP